MVSKTPLLATSKWTVVPVVVTSRRLVSPAMYTGAIPVIAIDDLPNWIGNHDTMKSRKEPQACILIYC